LLVGHFWLLNRHRGGGKLTFGSIDVAKVDKKKSEAQQVPGIHLSIEDLCSIASKFAQQGRYEDAIELYEQGIKVYPSSLALKINMGKARNMLKEKEQEDKRRLMGMFKEERSKKDRLSFQLVSLGNMFIGKGQFEKAEECFKVSLLHNPENFEARMELARAYYRMNDYAAAIRELKAVVQVNPFVQEAHALLGRSFFYIKNFKAALNSIVDAMVLDNAMGVQSPPELHEKFKYLLEKMGVHSRAARNDLVKVRLKLFEKCVKQLDVQKSAILGRGTISYVRELSKAKEEDTEKEDLLKLALRLRQFDILSSLNDENLFTVAQAVRTIRVEKQQLVFDEEDEGDEIYFVEKGKVRISKDTPFGEQILARIGKGEFFGEMNFIDPVSRSADALADEGCTLFCLKREDVVHLFDHHKEVAVQFYWHFWKSLSRRTREANNLLKTFFSDTESHHKEPMTDDKVSKSKEISIDLDRKLQLLQDRGLSAKELRLLAAFSVEELYNRNELIFREGDVGDKLYIILDGKVRIVKHIPGVGEEALAILEKGDFFGEMALVDNEPRSADAKAHVNGTTVLTISREVLNEILSVDIESAYQFLSILCRILTQRLREINLKIIQWRLMSGGF
jgi:CRP/FNR family cyclic AMP-dependent transcriptional regulator